MSGRRVLIVNADDFGRTHGVNRGVITAHEEGIVTSASLMVRWPAAEAAAAYARQRTDLGVGLHLDIGEWEYVDYEWRPTYEVVDPADADAVESELAKQLDRFQVLVGHPPTHLDSHQHVHRTDPVRSALGAAGRDLGIPVREMTPGITYRGDFYGQDGRGYPVPEAITSDALIALIESLPEGVTELGCHPGDASDLENVYRRERALEVAALCDVRVHEALRSSRVELTGFAQVHAG